MGNNIRMSSNPLSVPVCLQVAATAFGAFGANYKNNMQYSIDITLIITQTFGQDSINYDLNRITPGMWIAGGVGGYAWRITSVGSTGSDEFGSMTMTGIIAEDVNNYNYTISGTNAYNPPANPDGSQPYLIFQLSADGLPVLQGLYKYYAAPLQELLPDITARFSNTLQNTQYIDVLQVNHGLNIGDAIYISDDDGNGNAIYSRVNTLNYKYTMGIVSNINSIEGSINLFTYKVFGTLYNDVSSSFSSKYNDADGNLVISTLSFLELFPTIKPGDIIYSSGDDISQQYSLTNSGGSSIALWIFLGNNTTTQTEMAILNPFVGGSGGGGGGGVGVPPGGTAGQILAKIDDTDYNTHWIDSSGGGGGGGGGGNIIYNDPWIQTNFIDPPPGLVFQTISATTTQIFVPWTNPTQFPIGLVTSYIPVINSLWANTRLQIPEDSNITLLSNATTPYINSNGTPNISGIVFSKLDGISGFESNVAFPAPVLARNAYVYYNTSLANIVADTSDNTISIWYRNTNSNSNVATAILSTFLQSGQPTEPRSLALSNATGTTGTFTYIEPEFVDSNDSLSLLSINLYTITYDSAGSTNRYDGPIAHSLDTIANSTNLSYNLTSLYPDSLYTLQVNARNSANISGPYASTTATTSTMATVPALSGTLPFPERYYTGVNIQSGSITNTLLNTNSNWTSLAISTPINAIANRGLLGGSNSTLMYISTTLTLGTTSTIGPEIGFTGYPISIPGSNVASNITLSPTTVLDTYSTDATNQQGFFLHSVNTITLNSDIFIASASTYTLTAIQSGAVSGSATISFQYDGDPGTPGGSMSFNFNGSNYAPVSGVNIVYGTPTFEVTTTASNLGEYFYKSPILEYTGSPAWTPSNETNLTNVTSGLNVGSNFTNPVEFQRSISTNLATSYQSTIGLSGTIYNVANSNSISLTTIPAIVDGPSYTLVYSTLPQTLPTVSNANTPVIGYHVTSAVAGAANVPPFVDSNNNSYASTPYNNSLHISGLQELQVSNGTFTTPSASLLSYKNYTGFYYDATNSNTANYSGISHSGYRYTTFAWKLASTGTGNYNSLRFTINTTKTIVITGGVAHVGSSPIRLYYRFENNASKIPTGLDNPLTSAWINGNSQTGTEANASTYVTPELYTDAPTWGLLGTIHASNEFPVFFTPIQVTSQIVYLYCRIGIPMNEDFSFSYVTAKMT